MLMKCYMMHGILRSFLRAQDVGNGIAAVAGLVPQFALGSGLMNLSFMPILGFFDNTVYAPLDGNIAGKSLVYMAICGATYLVLVLALERYSTCTCVCVCSCVCMSHCATCWYTSALHADGVEWGKTTSHPQNTVCTPKSRPSYQQICR